MKKVILAIILSVAMTGICMAGPRNSCANGSCSKPSVVVKKEVKTTKTVKKTTETTNVVKPLRSSRTVRPLRRPFRLFKRAQTINNTVLLA